MAIVTGQDILAADVNAIGAGHITILPWDYSAIGQGTWIFDISASEILNGNFRNSSSADGDNISYKAWLATGTYTLLIVYRKNPNHGIMDVDVDGVEEGSVDTYAGGNTFNNVFTITGVTVATGKLLDIKIRVDGKNGSSGNYQLRIQSLGLWRTA